jgi:uncharacterized protein
MFKLGKKLNGYIGKRLWLGITAISLVMLFISYSESALADTIRWYISPSDPYIQTWSDPSAISVDNNWDLIRAMNGYRGDNLVTTQGVNPQTVLADGEMTPLSVIANQSNPNTLIPGGVAEFDGITNPTIALKGSDVASAPHLVIQLQKESCPDNKFISVSYKLRDLDSTATNAASPVALQYRVGTTGNYINVPSGYVADATNQNTATKVSTVVTTLPHIAVTDVYVYIRILMTNAVGNDEWVGVDDINVACFTPTVSSATVSGRVMDGKSGVPRATVLLTDDGGNTFSVRTNSFGYYKFENLTAGRFYLVNVYSKNYQFDPRLLSLTDSIDNLDFYPQP